MTNRASKLTEAIDQDVIELLERSFNMPSPSWWIDADQAFAHLQELLRPKTDAILGDELGEGASGDAVLSRLVRQSSLPSIAILPAGSHAMRTTASNELLECIVFGSVGSTLFLELFWESVIQAQHTGEIVLVHEIQASETPRIVLRLRSHVFVLHYLQSTTLARSHSSILDATVPFSGPSFSKDLQELIGVLRSEHNVREDFIKNRALPIAYYYMRAFAITRGQYRPHVTGREIVSHCNNHTKDDFSSIIRDATEHWREEHPEIPENQNDDWCGLLRHVADEPFYKRMKWPFFIRIAVLFSGASEIKGGAWLAMVERKLKRLKERLEARIPLSEILIWPQRLASPHHLSSQDGLYEGCFVLNFNMPGLRLSAAREVIERWELQIREDELTVDDECFINAFLSKGPSDLERHHLQNLRPCTRKWPRPIIKPPEDNQSNRRPPILSKHEKKTVRFAHKDILGGVEDKKIRDSTSETPRLRPATDVLNRIRFDRKYRIDQCVIGYKDRHTSEIKEKPASYWVKETTHQDFIPEHRIEYFKMEYKDGKKELLWDKSLRLDNVFHSGNPLN